MYTLCVCMNISKGTKTITMGMEAVASGALVGTDSAVCILNEFSSQCKKGTKNLRNSLEGAATK